MPAHLTFQSAAYSMEVGDDMRIPSSHSSTQLTARQLLDDTGPLGATFETSYYSVIDSMTARSRDDDLKQSNFPSYLLDTDGGTFRTHQPCPEYTVISYTWGRWKLKTRDMDSPVQGAHWNIPANSLFSREELDSAVRNIAAGSSVWVDVFCIPQDDSDPEKAIEIGKQSGIFRLASRAAVWLCSGGEETLVELCSIIPEVTALVPPDIFPELVVEARRRIKMVIDLPRVVPWLTSLWTLQEAALRVDAVFYNKEGIPLRHSATGNLITIRHFLRTLREIDDALGLLDDEVTLMQSSPQSIPHRADDYTMTQEDISLLKEAQRAVETIGLLEMSNMNTLQLLRAASQRTCERAHDRVYGIMGAVGVTVPVDYKEDPSITRNKFFLELHRKLPAEMQAFRRLKPLDDGAQCWLAGRDSTILGLIRQLTPPEPPVFNHVDTNGHLEFSSLSMVSSSVVEELITRELTESILPTFDADAVCQVLGSARIPESQSKLDCSERCRLYLDLFSRAQLGLINLGSIGGLDSLGWTCAYMLVVSVRLQDIDQRGAAKMFRRIGIMVAGDRMTSACEIEGQFLLI